MSFLVFLHEKGVINRDLYELASGRADRDTYICDVLVSNGEFDSEGIAKLRSEFFGLEYTDLKSFDQIDGLIYNDLETVLAIPFESHDGYTWVAIYDPDNLDAINTVDYALTLCETTRNSKLVYCIASKEKIKQKFREINAKNEYSIEQILLEATTQAASDIHITPFEKIFKIMFRIDGILVDHKIFDISEFKQLSIAIKVLAKLDISENRRPQSGSFQNGNIDFRISTHPTFYGENIVIRILNKDKSLILIDKIGFSPEQITYLKSVCSFSNGMIIFCGPTGSGKTTSIYSLIETMDKKGRNIMTLEDPIEYKISNVRQTEIIPGVISFADGIRSILRQDPDVILIGEIRDNETAKMAVRASMTGHLVLSTIHANDSFGVISRLREFEIPDSLIADNLISVISQRLIRKKAARGRTIVSEILKITQTLKELIYNGENKAELEKQAKSEGFNRIYDDCRSKIQAGIISTEDAWATLSINCG